LFVTLDGLGARHSASSLEQAYAAAAALAEDGLDFVLPPLPTRTDLSRTVPLGDGAVSVTWWVDGSSGRGDLRDDGEVRETAALLGRLHGARPPASLPAWRPLFDARLVDALTDRVAAPWDRGPFGEQAREAVTGHLDDVRRWTDRYLALTDEALAAQPSWVPTHGEPHTGNHLVAGTHRYLVDWESLKLAPRERDLDGLVASGGDWLSSYGGARPDARMLAMFDLEWRLDEIDQYSVWFAAPHTGSASDEVALAGLLEELARPDRA
jgi:spectinomycin phosphotransferase